MEEKNSIYDGNNKIKYLRINLIRNFETIYNESYKTFFKEKNRVEQM